MPGLDSRQFCAAPRPRPPQPMTPTRIRSEPPVAPMTVLAPSWVSTAAPAVAAEIFTKSRRVRSGEWGGFIGICLVDLGQGRIEGGAAGVFEKAQENEERKTRTMRAGCPGLPLRRSLERISSKTSA